MKVAVIGAGAVGSSIARELVGNGHDVVVIDQKPEAIGRLDLRGCRWVVGDACELDVLEDAGLGRAEVMVAATGDDRVNLVVSLMARSEFGVPRTVGRVNHPKNEWLFDASWGVDVAVSTPRLMTALVEEAVEVGDVVRVLSLQNADAALSAYTVPRDHPVIGSRVGSIPWPVAVAPVAILRDGLPIAPSRDDVVEADDELFFLVADEGEEALRELFRTDEDRARTRSRDGEPAPWAEPAPTDPFGEQITGDSSAGEPPPEQSPTGGSSPDRSWRDESWRGDAGPEGADPGGAQP